jgi:cytochrome c-type biogenesis protein
VFVTLGASASVFGGLLRAYSYQLSMVAGVAIIAMGLHFLNVLRIPWLARTKRLDLARPVGLWGAYAMGLAFAFGWTPCIGPILGAILLYASQQETVWQGVVLLMAYSAGLGIPFLLAALAVNWFFKASSGLRKSMRVVEVASGVLLVGVGLLLVTDQLTLIAQWFTRMFPALATIG